MVLLCVIFKSVWYARHFEYSCMRCMFMHPWKQAANRLKMQERLLLMKKIYNSVKHLQRQQFSFMKTSIKVSPKLLSHVSLSHKQPCSFMFILSRLPGVCYFSRWTRGKKIAQSFLFTVKFITRYSSERFLSICGEKMPEGFLKFCKLMTNLILGQTYIN